MRQRLLPLLAALAMAACSSPFALRHAQGDTSNTLVPERVTQAQSKWPIKHVVFVIQENRSFNNLFMGYPGATTARYGYDTQGNKIRVRPRTLWSSWDPGHSSDDFFAACDGQAKLPGTECKMDGWTTQPNPPNAPQHLAYSYVPQTQIAPDWAIAEQYALADDMFTSNLDGSFISHQYAVAAYASHAVDFPSASWGCEGGKTDTLATLTKERAQGAPIVACFDNPTIATEADAAGVSWRFYAGTPAGDGGTWSSYQADRKIYYGADWSADVISPPAQFLTDVGNGELAAVTWITPTYETSDHPSTDAKYGPAWVASIVNAIGTSKFWKSTAIFIMWDDWGGWFDPVPPVYEDYDGLGFRVPLLIVSPYTAHGKVTHVQYETASVLRFIEDNFGLAPLAKSDARANDPAADPLAFDYHQPPRAFKKIRGAKPSSFWIQLERRASKPHVPALPGED